ncbi:MAG: hypothetical protein GY754_23265 [bacterium]|nr:hypothetical protein [bacterium]
MTRTVKPILSSLICIVVIILCSSGAFAQNKKRVAILGFGANNTSKEYAKVVRDIFEVRLFKTGSVEILERDRIDIILNEQGFELTGCVDTECAVKIGKILSVDMVAVGSINKTGKFTIIIKFVDITKARVAYADSESAQTEDHIEDAIEKLASKIAAHPVFAGTGSMPEPVSASYGYYLRGFVPGWGQFYSGKSSKGYLFSGGFIASSSFAIYGFVNYRLKKDSYHSLSSSASGKEFTEKYDAYDNAAIIAQVSLGVFAAVYVINWIDIIFFSKPSAQKMANAFSFENTYISFNITTINQNNRIPGEDCLELRLSSFF